MHANYFKDGITHDENDAHDIVLYALFSRTFIPIGFLDFHSSEACKLLSHLQRGRRKSVVVSFGSPYFCNQYFERAPVYVNAYSMLSPSVKAFAGAVFGENSFSAYSPVEF